MRASEKIDRNTPARVNRWRAALGSAVVAVVAAAGTVGLGQAPTPSRTFQLEEATIADIQSAIKSGEITTVSLVNAYLERIRAFNGTCVDQPDGYLGSITPIKNAGQLNALATLNLRPAARKAWGFEDRKARSLTDLVDDDPNMPDALEMAAMLDRRFAETGQLAGPLHGVVVSLKEQFDTFDMRSTNGADVAYANDRPPRDSTVAERLRKAGAIVLAKANRGGFASRSAFGGTVCNPYDTERTPRGSSSGSAVGVSANFVTCSIGEETGTSIRVPSSSSNVVGLAPTQELISRAGMAGPGLTVRFGPICRTVQDAAKVLEAVVGYDAKDPFTAFSVGRIPESGLSVHATGERLDGVRIGVIREFMDARLYSKRDEEAIGIIDRAVADLQRTGATIVDPGQGGALFTSCFQEYVPLAFGKLFTSRYPEMFPVDADGQPTSDHIETLVDLKLDPSRVPTDISIREIGQMPAVGDSAYWRLLYFRQRGDAAIKTPADLSAASKQIDDPQFRASSPNISTATPYGAPRPATPAGPPEIDMADRMLQRWAFQQVVLSCMADMNLDAVVYPTNNIPPQIIQSPEEPAVNGRNQAHWIIFGYNGFPTITVPAGFTEQVYDRVPDPSSPDGTRMVGPVPAKLPVGLDFAARPFNEALLVRVAAAFEALTKHRTPPPAFRTVPSS